MENLRLDYLFKLIFFVQNLFFFCCYYYFHISNEQTFKVYFIVVLFSLYSTPHLLRFVCRNLSDFFAPQWKSCLDKINRNIFKVTFHFLKEF